MVAKHHIISKKNLAVHAKVWYLNLWVHDRNLLSNKTRSVEGKRTEARKKGRQEKDYLVEED